jgi:hypothetical protein
MITRTTSGITVRLIPLIIAIRRVEDGSIPRVAATSRTGTEAAVFGLACTPGVLSASLSTASRLFATTGGAGEVLAAAASCSGT